MIPYGRQSINNKDIEAVLAVLQSDFLTQGPAVEQFEQAVASYVGAKYAVAVGNATQALHIACLAAGLTDADVLWTTPNTFVASANCARYVGAQVDFVDICQKTYNLSVSELKKKLSRAEVLPKVVIPVHFAGQACAMQELAELAKQYNFKVIEDASHAIGGEYLTGKVGNCQFSDMTVFSFHPVKIITTAEGGMVTTNSKELYEKLKLYRSHGITRDAELLLDKEVGPWYYEQQLLGFNYRMTDMQAALGFSQLQRVDAFVAKRRELVARYNELLQELPLNRPYQTPEANSAWHLYVICLQLEKLSKTKKQIFEELRAAGINVNLHYIPVHTQPYYQALGFKWGDFPKSESYYQAAITLPLYYDLSYEQQNEVIEVLKKILR